MSSLRTFHVLPAYSFAELIKMEQSKLLICLLFPHSVPTDKVWRVEKFSVESIPVSLDASGEVWTSSLH